MSLNTKHTKNTMVNVDITKMTATRIYYACPFCWTSRGRSAKQHGTFAPDRIPTVHAHSNTLPAGASPVGWTTHRSTHCRFNDEAVTLRVTEDTWRL